MDQIDLLNDGLDGGRVMAWMLFPSDPTLREAYLVREVVRHSFMQNMAADGIVQIPIEMLRVLLDGPSEREIKEVATESTKKGTVAGDLLGLIYEMAASNTDEPSLGKALEAYKHFALHGRYGDGEALKRSEQTLRDYFEAFKPVAHVWAAFRLNQGSYKFTDDPRNVFHNVGDMHKLLGIAKAIGSFASSFVPKRTKPERPVIDADQLVVIPDCIAEVRLKLTTV